MYVCIEGSTVIVSVRRAFSINSINSWADPRTAPPPTADSPKRQKHSLIPPLITLGRGLGAYYGPKLQRTMAASSSGTEMDTDAVAAESLPAELLAIVFDFAAAEAVLRCAAVCRTWRARLCPHA